MPACAVSICNKRSSTSSLAKDGVTFHFFPKDPEMKRIWTTACSRLPNWIPTRTSTICSRHFDASQYRTLPLSTSKIRKLIDFAIPTLNLYEKVNLPKSIAEPLTQVIKVEVECDVMQPDDAQPVQSSEHQPPNQHSTLLAELSKRKLIAKIEAQAKKIRRLQAQTLYLKRKVASLEELIINKDDENCLIVIEDINVENAD